MRIRRNDDDSEGQRQLEHEANMHLMPAKEAHSGEDIKEVCSMPGRFPYRRVKTTSRI
ncbi:MAG: hypothetical protein JW753_08995 [Dehalococcoidia bacterium]|nr:hypothetical protein [Dehalococcoidia bacterium]